MLNRMHAVEAKVFGQLIELLLCEREFILHECRECTRMYDTVDGPGQAAVLKIVPRRERGCVRVVGDPEANIMNDLKCPRRWLVQVEEPSGAFGKTVWKITVESLRHLLPAFPIPVRPICFEDGDLSIGYVAEVRRNELSGIERRDDMSCGPHP